MAETIRQLHSWTRTEYDRMVEAGVFPPGSRLELIEGEIVDMTPQGSHHFTMVRLLEDVLRSAFGPGFEVRTQGPLALDEGSEPEPDVAVVRGAPLDYLDAHPTTALLVVEVSDTSLGFDRLRKKRLYARNGIAEYWILDVNSRRLEVYRDPRGDDYAAKVTLGPEDRISPLASEGAEISVSALLKN